ncbi:Myo-inositol catabolism protein IolC [Jiangella alba]|uniref:Myo-inositol catabolism protein IolC n=2 Tax=Jiangella alba TaxID=561176 RepID=A0A1H5PXW9_9ACTN|nr:Myo-inositol catabolism protein IolC [Jiangella alba]
MPDGSAAVSDGGPPMAVLAFDHRERAFASVRSTGMTREEIGRSKELIFEAFVAAVDSGLAGTRPGVLIDEEFGAPIARRAAALGFPVSMPVERAFEPVFTFEYGGDYRRHLLEFRPACAKALVHHRTTDPLEARQTQLTRLRELSEFLAEQSIGFMLELIVGQSDGGTGQIPTVDVEELCGSMAEMQNAGVLVDQWKVEGISSPDEAAQVAAQAVVANPRATCVVLGAGAPNDVVGHWLDVAAATPGFSGFAIGRSIWGGAVASWLDGRLARHQAIEQIASTYRSCALRYMGARVS